MAKEMSQSSSKVNVTARDGRGSMAEFTGYGVEERPKLSSLIPKISNRYFETPVII